MSASQPRNYCASCDRDFYGLDGFDAHREGRFEYGWSLEKPDGRRCLNADELRAKGYDLNATAGLWFNVKRRDRMQRLRPGLPSRSRSPRQGKSGQSRG